MFPLNYRHDPGLEFLEDCSHEDLHVLVDILTKHEGKKRWTEYLTGDERFKQHLKNLPKAWQIIAAEFQRYGADSIMSMLRGGQGVPYREILLDICSKLGVPSAPRLKRVILEKRLLSKLLADAWEKMSDEAKQDFIKNWNKSNQAQEVQFDPSKMAPAAVLAALQTAILTGGFAAYQIAVILANGVAKAVLGRGIAFAGNAAMTQYLAVLAGPIGWALSALLTVPAFTGPSYRVTIPATIYIAYLRQKFFLEGK